MKNFGRSLALAVSLAVSAGANASIITIVEDADTQDFNTPTSPAHKANSYWADSVSGVVGGHLQNQNADFISVTYEYIFKEAVLTNEFVVNGINGEQVISTGPASPQTVYTSVFAYEIVEAGAFLDFSFITGLGTVISNDPSSANQNHGDTGIPGFFITYNSDEDAYYIALDDNGTEIIDGVAYDDNHDDMIIRVTAVPGIAFEVPEPASLALLGLGLMGAGFASRRKS